MRYRVSIGVVVVLSGLMSTALRAGQEAPSQRGGDFAPDTILVKLKEGVSAVPADAVDATGLDASNLPPFNGIHPGIRPASVKPLFRAFRENERQAKALLAGERAARTLRDTRLLRRAQRMPQGVTTPDLSRIYRVRVDLEPGESLLDVVAAYRRSPYVEYAEPDYQVQLFREPNDPGYAQQWALQKISAPQAWDLHTGSPDVVVAVIDTGVAYTLPDLQENMWVNEAELAGQEGVDDDDNGYIDDVHGYDFAYEDGEPLDDFVSGAAGAMILGHGTAVAGVIAARGNNGMDLCGVCWRATIMAVKATDPDTLGANSTIVEAVYYAIANGADILSCSWGMNPPSQALYDVFQYAYSQGVVAVAGAGNDGLSSVFYPAGYSTVISVGASSEGDGRASWSNYGNWVDIMAPGTNMTLLTPYGGTMVAQGTSFACPYVSGACALLLSMNPSLTPAEVHDLVMNNGDRVMQGVCKSNSRLNVFKALSALMSSTGTIHFDQATYRPGSTVSASLIDADLKNAGTCDVAFTTDANDVETLTLTEDTPGTGVFHGSITTAAGTPEPNDGILELSDGDVVTMTYRDAKGATRQYANRERLVEKTATIDGRAPAMSNIAIDASLPQPRVTFETDEPAVATIRYRLAGAQEPWLVTSQEQVYAKSHTIVLQDLAIQTEYEFHIEVTDRVGNVTREDNGGTGYAFTAPADPGQIHAPEDFATVQEAIDHCWPGDTVWVADGTYSGPGNRDIDFGGKRITVRSDNGPENCIIDCQGSQQSLHRGFYFHHGETADAVLDGFTITGGWNQSDTSDGIAARGGAVLCCGASPTIRNCILRDSTAAQGGGLGIYAGSHVVVTGCVFLNNTATWGGGAYGGDDTILELTDCTFKGNRGASYYGGFFCGYTNAQTIVTRCLFQENSAYYGAGAIGVGSSRATITHSQFVANTVGRQGGAIMLSDSHLTVSRCIFSGNRSDERAAVLYNYASQVDLASCTFAGNAAVNGRAMSSYGIAQKTTSLRATNCIFRDGGHELFSEGAGVADILIDYSDFQGGYPGQGNIDADPCFVDAGRWDDNHTPKDPADDFWVDGDYHLLSEAGGWSPALATWITAGVTSPCIDAGDPNSPVGDEPAPNGGRINMGAYGGTPEASKSPSP